MEITIEHCNSIDAAKISLVPGRLNIKYGPNGTGKSTIAKAIEFASKGGTDLSTLTPFKYKGGDPQTTPSPSVKGADQFKSVVVFSEEYVDQFVFKQDEVVKDSFDIFIKNSDYEQKMAEIEGLISNIKDTFNKNDSIDQVLKDLADLSDSFGKSQSGYSKAGRIGKAIGNGNKLEHIPEKLTPYTKFIRSESNVKWIGWQIKGNEFLSISTECPYCTAPTEEKKETILAVSVEYDAKAIEHLSILQGIIGRLGKYFSPEVRQKIDVILKNKAELKKEEIAYLTVLKTQIDTLREKLQDTKSISFFSLRDVGEIKKRISALNIDLSLLAALESPETKAIVDEINNSLASVLGKAGMLQGEVNKQKKSIETAISKYKAEINSFLRYAGYKYIVDIQPVAESYKMKLRHLDFAENIENGAKHLSYGERNAFSIILFMYECLTKAPDLIVLDDPISSFDKNKKFAILEMLFRGKDSLRDKTVLMLTHDIEPVIDMVKSLSHKFQPIPVASFLKSKAGTVVELEVEKSDLLSFAQICDENIKTHGDDIIKSIYLRRHYEVIDDKGLEYQLLANLFHKRATPLFRSNGVERPMTQAEIDAGSAAIQVKLTSFDYAKLLNRLLNDTVMVAAYHSAQNGYEKLQLFRIINNENHENDVVKKYINESFHIENEYIMQLNPHKFDFVPDYIIAECDQAMAEQ
ncbi:MAG: AAA family ATPase [Gallionella sp.]|nr:AAA family ATPase [Gallionella sp.]